MQRWVFSLPIFVFRILYFIIENLILDCLTPSNTTYLAIWIVIRWIWRSYYENLICDDRYYNNMSTGQSTKTAGGLNTCKCEICGKSFENVETLNYHTLLEHSEHKRPPIGIGWDYSKLLLYMGHIDLFINEINIIENIRRKSCIVIWSNWWVLILELII